MGESGAVVPCETVELELEPGRVGLNGTEGEPAVTDRTWTGAGGSFSSTLFKLLPLIDRLTGLVAVLPPPKPNVGVLCDALDGLLGAPYSLAAALDGSGGGGPLLLSFWRKGEFATTEPVDIALNEFEPRRRLWIASLPPSAPDTWSITGDTRAWTGEVG